MTEIRNTNSDTSGETILAAPDMTVDAREMFGVDLDMPIPAFSQKDERVPDFDPNYVFDHDTTAAILAGFAYNRRVMIQGYHGTGNRLTSNRWPRGSTGRASVSTSTRISAVST